MHHQEEKRRSRRRHSCPYNLNRQSEIAGCGYHVDTNQQTINDVIDDDEINIDDANMEWNRSQQIGFFILCTFSVVIGIALIIILIILKFL